MQFRIGFAGTHSTFRGTDTVFDVQNERCDRPGRRLSINTVHQHRCINNDADTLAQSGGER